MIEIRNIVQKDENPARIGQQTGETDCNYPIINNIDAPPLDHCHVDHKSTQNDECLLILDHTRKKVWLVEFVGCGNCLWTLMDL